ncbi:uncharacterized protein [Rutidosis leptorrhynchoides]|uniref:uncharacterized protein n=1 Tax=Rutidosis leptorrhynchoides TaxID=125765 RepID=UPI003A99E47E
MSSADHKIEREGKKIDLDLAPRKININAPFCFGKLSVPIWALPFCKVRNFSSSSFILYAKKRRDSGSEPILKPSIVEQVSMDDAGEEEDEDDFQDDDDVVYGDFEEEFMEDEDAEVYVRLLNECFALSFGVILYGAGGGGIALAGTWWDKEALSLAQDVCTSFEGDLNMYAFRTLPNFTIQVRIERLTNKSGSPNMEDIEAFTTRYRARLEEAEQAKSIPENISLEVSSPGVERVVRVPHELEWFKDRNMYVRYISQVSTTGQASESDDVFKLISYDTEEKCCTWGLADVRINREKAGKGRPLSKKQREFRVVTPFDSLLVVRFHSEW